MYYDHLKENELMLRHKSVENLPVSVFPLGDMLDLKTDRWTKHLIRHKLVVPMDHLRVHLLRASKSIEGTTMDVCEQIGRQIDSDLAIKSPSKSLVVDN
jgi:hypothetical protein